MRRIEFIAAMFCLGLAGLLVGGMELYKRMEYYFNGKAAVMQLADPTRKVALPPGGYHVHLLDVRYVGADGTVVMPQKRLVGENARRVANGDKIPLTYLKHDPQRVKYPGDELPNPWGWLFVGAAAMGVFVHGPRLLRKEET